MNHSRFDMRKRRARVLYVENKKKKCFHSAITKGCMWKQVNARGMSTRSDRLSLYGVRRVHCT